MPVAESTAAVMEHSPCQCTCTVAVGAAGTLPLLGHPSHALAVRAGSKLHVQ